MNMRRYFFRNPAWAVVVFLLMGTGFGVAEAAILTNGSFESDIEFLGWDVHLFPGGNIRVQDNQGKTDGSRAAVFNSGYGFGGGGVGGSLSQRFNTLVGEEYQLEFDYGVFYGSNVTVPLQVEVIGNSVLIDQEVFDRGSNPTTFKTFTFFFAADSSATVLRFTDYTTVSGTKLIDLNLDRVSVSGPTQMATPLPAAAWLFGSALCSLLAIGRRNRRQST